MTRNHLFKWGPAILLLAFGCMDQSRPKTGTPLSAACDLVVDELGMFGMDATVENHEDSCLVDVAVPLASLDTDLDPLENLRESMVASGWIEDIESMADGPGTSSFRLVSSDRFCQIEGGAPAWIDDDDEIRQSDEYFVNVVCALAH